MSEDWISRLKVAYDAGYYRTEVDQEWQTGFPWQHKTCKDCPFWLNSVCRVHAVPRPPDADTCSYFDLPNHRAAQHIIDERMQKAWRQWWEWRGRHGSST
jgi:hypothetical protein